MQAIVRSLTHGGVVDLDCFLEDDLHVLTDAQRREFQKLWNRETGGRITDDDAESYATALVRLGAISLSISQNRYE